MTKLIKKISAPFISLILYIPRDLSIVEVLIAVVVFIFTIYSAIRALKYFKILQSITYEITNLE